MCPVMEFHRVGEVTSHYVSLCSQCGYIYLVVEPSAYGGQMSLSVLGKLVISSPQRLSVKMQMEQENIYCQN